jgi:hypothetical protein
MATREIQQFLTRYIRDPGFAARWNGDERDALVKELGLSEEDMTLIGGLDLADLDRTGTEMRSDRLYKRKSEFTHFLDWLGVYGPVDVFLNEYHAAYPKGSEAQGIELGRFLDFSIRFVARQQLPDFLAELARFCFEYCRTAVADRASEPDSEEPPDFEVLPLTSPVQFAAPWRVVEFSYDCLEIANTPAQAGALPPRRTTRLLFLKSRDSFKRSVIWRLEDLPPSIQRLTEGPRMLAEVVAPVGASNLTAFFDHLRLLYEGEVIEFPRDAAGPPAPSNTTG